MRYLDDITAAALRRTAEHEKLVPFEEMRARALGSKGDHAFARSLEKEGLSFICEIKRASPSKGMIAEDFRPSDIAEEYAAAGADAISVLTEPTRFLGSDELLSAVAGRVGVPVLRKDFVVSPYMVYEARVLGASAVLLICEVLGDGLADCLAAAEECGLDALVEAHCEDEVKRAVRSGARIVGVNNRDLRTFGVDLSVAVRMRGLVPDDMLFVAESGIKTAADVLRMAAAGADAVLIGETLMRSADKRAALAELKSALWKDD